MTDLYFECCNPDCMSDLEYEELKFVRDLRRDYLGCAPNPLVSICPHCNGVKFFIHKKEQEGE